MTDARLQALYQEALGARSAVRTAECPAPERLLALVEREGSEDERLATLDHALSCGACARELELLRALRMASLASQRPRVAGRWLLAASAVIAVVGSALLFRPGSESGRLLRGDSHGETGVVLLAPAAHDSVLRWHAVPRAVRYAVEVLDA